MRMGGPIWTDPIVDEGFLGGVLGEMEGDEGYGHGKRMVGKLRNLSNEVLSFLFQIFFSNNTYLLFVASHSSSLSYIW